MSANSNPPREPKPAYNQRNTACVIEFAGKHRLESLDSIPDSPAPVPTEAQEQIALATWLRGRSCLFLHIPNEGKRSGANGALLKKMGLQAGAPDMLVFGSTAANPLMPGAAVEMKRRDGDESDVRASQREWLAALREKGWHTVVAYGAQEAVEFLKRLGY